MSSVALKPAITPDDRFGLTLCVAIIVHAMVILGVSFAPEPDPAAGYEAMEILLVPEKSQAPEKAEALAQTNLQGGGKKAQSESSPASPVRAPLPSEKAEIAAQSATPPTAIAPVPAPPAARVGQESQQTRAEKLREAAELLVRATPTSAPLPAQGPADRLLEGNPAEEPVSEPVPKTPAPPTQLPTAAQLLTRSFALASLNADLQQRLDARATNPRQKYISANTREFRYAAYMEAWRAKVERIGNINYPDEARRRELSGNLLLDVALYPDGSVAEITVRRSSGHKVLDAAAVRIVELAAPFAPFPDDIREEVDILHVTRTWKFLNNQQFSAR